MLQFWSQKSEERTLSGLYLLNKKRKVSKKNVDGNWRGIEDAFFNKVRKGFQRILGPKY